MNLSLGQKARNLQKNYIKYVVFKIQEIDQKAILLSAVLPRSENVIL